MDLGDAWYLILRIKEKIIDKEGHDCVQRQWERWHKKRGKQGGKERGKAEGSKN